MKAFVKKRNGKYGVYIVQDHQSFWLDYYNTKEYAQWYAKMFRIALKRHAKK